MAQSKSPDSDDMAAQITALREEMSSITEAVGSIVKDQKKSLSEAAQKGIDEVRSRGADALSSAQEQAEALNAQARDFVKEKPALSLGVAAALGLAVGILATWRR